MYVSSCTVLNNAAFCACPSPYTGATCSETIGKQQDTDTKFYLMILFFVVANNICATNPNICRNGATYVQAKKTIICPNGNLSQYSFLDVYPAELTHGDGSVQLDLQERIVTQLTQVRYFIANLPIRA